MTLRYPLLLAFIGFISGFMLRPAGGFRPADISEMVSLPPIGMVGSISQGNRATPDPDASADASEALRQALFRHDEKLHLTKQLVIKDSAMQRAVASLTIRAVSTLESYRKRPLPMPPPWLDTLLAAQKQRYCLLSYAQGYTRNANNYRGRIAKDLGIGLLTMGMLVPISYQSYTRVGVFIYDAEHTQWCITSPACPLKKTH